MKISSSDTCSALSHSAENVPQIGLARRDFLKLSGATVASSLVGVGAPLPALASEKKISAVMVGVILNPKTREVVEKATSVKIENVPYVSPTDTVAKLMAPGGTSRYDLMISVTEFVKGPVLGVKAGDEKVASLDMSKVPNAANLQSVFKSEVQRRGDKTLMVPILWGYDSPLYRTDLIGEGDPNTQAWGVLFNDKYAGRVALRDDAYQSIMAAALHLGHESPASMSAGDLAEVKKFLISKKKNFRTLWTKFGEAVNLMSSGEVWAMYGWMPMRAALHANGVKVKNAWPKEGILLWNMSAFIPKDSKNVEATTSVVNAMLSPEFGVAMTEATNYGSASQKAIDAFSVADQERIGLNATTRGGKLNPLKWPNDMNSWIEAWGAFKAA